MRISSSQIFQNGIDTLQRNQQALSKTQLQLSTGKRIVTPSDDPSGSVQSLQFRSGIAKLEQYQRNGQLLEQRLSQSETVLGMAVDGLQKVRELAVQGNNATQTDETRGFIAGEIRQTLDALRQLANSQDANGEYLFAGLKSLTQPFTVGDAGQVIYNGDGGQRSLQISPTRQLAVGDSGQRVFMDIPDGNGTFAVRDHGDPDDPNEPNTGTGVVTGSSVVKPETWTAANGATFTVKFVKDDDGPLQYQVLNQVGVELDPPGSQEFKSGQTIEVAGVQFTLEGRPEDDDTFTVAPSEFQDLFATYRQLADALEQPATGGASGARLNNAVNRALQELDTGLGRLLDTQASLGSRLQAVENQNRLNGDQLLQFRSTLSQIEDLDYAEAVSRFSLQQTALEAAQQTYVQVQRLSLFNFL